MDLDDVRRVVGRCKYPPILLVQLAANALYNLISHLARELPYSVPFSAEVELINASFGSWGEIANKCLDKVVAVWRGHVMKLVLSVLKSHYQDWTCVIYLFTDIYKHALNRGFRDRIDTQIAALARQTKEKIDWLTTMEFSPYTQSFHDFSVYRDHHLRAFRSERPVSIFVRSCLRRLYQYL